jgi:hypothetical protein
MTLRDPREATGPYYLGRVYELQGTNAQYNELSRWLAHVAQASRLFLGPGNDCIRPGERERQPGFFLLLAGQEVWLPWERARALMVYLEQWLAAPAPGHPPPLVCPAAPPFPKKPPSESNGTRT